jgi:uncharacterized protein (TIGR02145 family)
MKKFIVIAIIIFTAAFHINAQNDTMYIMKSGAVIAKYNVNTQIDSVIFYQPQNLQVSDSKDSESDTFTDSRDGTVYKMVTIGDQVWMAENLKYLPTVVPDAIGSGTEPYYYVYGYEGSDVSEAKATKNYSDYGVLYNWTAAMGSSASSNANPSNVQGACPDGWHLPSDAEWIQLSDFLGGLENAGRHLKETGTEFWDGAGSSGSNEFGFSARPGGNRLVYGNIGSMGMYGSWWTATESEEYSDQAWKLSMGYNFNYISRQDYFKEAGYSVRCVKD